MFISAATDIIILVFAIFLFISFLHDLTNLLMTYRSIQYLKRFSRNSKPHQNGSRRVPSIGSNRISIISGPINEGKRESTTSWVN